MNKITFTMKYNSVDDAFEYWLIDKSAMNGHVKRTLLCSVTREWLSSYNPTGQNLLLRDRADLYFKNVLYVAFEDYINDHPTTGAMALKDMFEV